ncbi:phthiocerol/phthiodiolone dimycocerosyl transferase family protein [Kitasatospora sp. LaBMicrA B282]|uniref:phthiocerol/phthiodiolone dimycocerosyl transferase family protein n=1 Tax=Kitasatospora sp. LaBMicrA B282 TaxID=3420949 RepID=UPI003D0A3F47
MQRLLCPVETLYVAQRSRAVVSCTVAGGVDPQLLGAAFADLTAKHPPLRCRIAREEAGFVLQELDAPPRLVVREDTGDGYPQELNSPLPVGGPLARATLLCGPESDTVVLAIDHAIIDGHSAIALHHALWERYAELLAAPDTAPEPYRTEWPAPLSELLPPCPAAEADRYFDRRVAEVRSRPVELLPYDAAGTATGGRIEVARLVLAAGPTADLRRAAATAGVSVQGLLAAALLVTARRRLPGEGARTLGCLSPVDLRSRLAEPLPREVMVAAVTSHAQAFEVAPDGDLLALAGEVTGGLRAAVAAGQPLLEVRIMPRVPEFPPLLAATVIATNMGAVPPPPLPAGLELRELRLVPAREQYFPQAGRSPLMACVTTFDGRLAVEFPYWTECYTDTFMAGFRDEVRHLLLDLAAPAGPSGGAAS